MALCEGQLDSALPQIKNETHEDIKPNIPNLTMPMPAVDYMSPRAHFVPPEIELYSHKNANSQPPQISPNVTISVKSRARSESPVAISDDDDEPRQRQPTNAAGAGAVKRKRGRPRKNSSTAYHGNASTVSHASARPPSASPPTPVAATVAVNRIPSTQKRKRGRPRVDKTSPEYLARHAAKLKARHEQSVNRASISTPVEKRKRGRPRVDKTSPEYIARKVQRERELMEKRAQRQLNRRNTADSNASSTKRYNKSGTEAKKRGRKKKIILGPDGQPIERNDIGMPKKRGRPSKSMQLQLQRGAILNSEPIPVDSDDEQLGSPSGRSDSLSLDENYRALRHLHEKYANIASEDYTMVQGNELIERIHSSSSSSSSSGSGSSSDSDSDSGSDSGSTSSSGDSTDSEGEGIPKIVAGNGEKAEKSKNGKSGSSSSDSDSSVPEDYGEPGDGSLSESENESADKRFQCHYCRKWYSTLVTLKIHRRIHLNRGKQNNPSNAPSSSSRRRDVERYECDVCLQAFTRREKLWDHKASAHRGAMTVRCSVCRRAFEDDAELAAHTHTEDERQGRCSICGCVFPAFELLRRHKMSAHAFIPASLPGGGGHMSSGGASSYACPQCNKNFSHAHSLARHLHNHANTVYRCVVCKQVYNDSDSLATHLNSHLATYKKLKQ